MRKQSFALFLMGVGLLFALQSCRNDDFLAQAPPTPDQSFVEQFDTLQNAHNRGWRWSNRSLPVGPANWEQAPGGAFSAYSSRGTSQGAAYASYLSTSGTNNGTISNWLISPVVIMQNGDKIIFYTRSQLETTVTPATDFGARMQLCLNTANESLDVGTGDEPGQFSEVLLDINPTEAENIPSSAATPATAYPVNWTRFERTIVGLNGPTKGRFAFRYYIHGAGTNGAANAIGIDSVAYVGRK